MTKWTLKFVMAIQDTIDLKGDVYTSYRDLEKYLHRCFPNSHIFIGDARIYLIYKDEIEKFSALNLGFYRDYIREQFDCEDYAISFKGIFKLFYGNYAFGTVAVESPRGRHMLNCFIDEFRKFWYFEPQENKIISLEDGEKVYGYRPFDIQI